MTSFQTFFRTVVMLGTLGLLAKVWYHHGPTVDELQSIGARVAEVAQQAWASYWQSSGKDASLANDPPVPTTVGPPAPFVPSGDPMQPIPVGPGPTTAPSAAGQVQFAGGAPAEMVPVAPSSPWPNHSIASPGLVPVEPQGQDPQLAEMLERLTQLGVRDQQIVPWGSSGGLVRFSCSVPWSNSPAYSRHFEAVAATPFAAVEQVQTEIDAWRSSQQIPVSSPP